MNTSHERLNHLITKLRCVVSLIKKNKKGVLFLMKMLNDRLGHPNKILQM